MKSTASSRTRAVVIAAIKTAASQNPLSVMETQTVRTAATRKAVVGVVAVNENMRFNCRDPFMLVVTSYQKS